MVRATVSIAHASQEPRSNASTLRCPDGLPCATDPRRVTRILALPRCAAANRRKNANTNMLLLC